jgi:hypothetical protein
MLKHQADSLRHAIENLIDAKLCDALNRRDGLARLVAHRTSGVVSADIRCAQRVLDVSLQRCLPPDEPSGRRPAA